MPAKVVIRVFFPNGLFKTASIDWSVTVEELISIIGKKLSLEYSSELDLTKCELYECQVETCGSSGEDGTSSSSSAPTSISSRAIWLEKPFGTTKHKLSSCDRPFPYVQSWISKNIASRCRFVMDYVPPASATASPISVASPAATAGAAGNGNEGAYGRNSSIFSVPPDMAAAATTTTTPSTQPQPIVSTSPPPPSSTASSTTAAPSPQSPQQTPKTQQSGGGGWHTYTCTRKRPDNVSEALASIGITERSTSPSPVPPQSPGVPAILVAATAAASETGAKSESGNGSAAKTSVEEKDDNESDADKAMKSALGTEWFGADGSSTKDGWSNDDRKPIPEQLITEALLPSTSPELPSCPAPAIPSDDNPQERYIAFLNKYLSGSGLSVKALDDLGSGVLVIRALEAMLSKSVFPMYDSPSSPEERLANWNVCLMILRIKGVAFNEASSEDLSNGDAEVLKQFLDHLMSVQSALSDVSVVTSSPAASVFSEASSGVIRFVYGKEAFLVPYADSASITIGALVGEVLVKVGKERLDIVVTYMSGKPCDVNSIVKDVLALNGGSSSFKLEDRK